MSSASSLPRFFGFTLFLVGCLAAGLAAWAALIQPGPTAILAAGRTMAELALSKPYDLLVLTTAIQAVVAGFAGLSAIALGVFLLRVVGQHAVSPGSLMRGGQAAGRA